MATYAIGDVQGCFRTLELLLEKIHFDPEHDKLWFTGDLVNRGPQSLATLRFIKNLKTQQHIVLGNHDLHLLAVAHGAHAGMPDDTLNDILNAPDREELLTWLQQQPLIHHDADLGYTLVHAGLAAQWDLEMAMSLAAEVTTILQSTKAFDFFQQMYGNTPNQWQDNLLGWDRLRCITNYLTRIRFCSADGAMELATKDTVITNNSNLVPWFKVPRRRNADLKIIFGHWAALGGTTQTKNTYALDTGCVWGFRLTAMRLEDEERFSVASVF